MGSQENLIPNLIPLPLPPPIGIQKDDPHHDIALCRSQRRKRISFPLSCALSLSLSLSLPPTQRCKYVFLGLLFFPDYISKKFASAGNRTRAARALLFNWQASILPLNHRCLIVKGGLSV